MRRNEVGGNLNAKKTLPETGSGLTFDVKSYNKLSGRAVCVWNADERASWAGKIAAGITKVSYKVDKPADNNVKTDVLLPLK